MYEEMTPPDAVLEAMAEDWRRSLPAGEDAADAAIYEADLATLTTASLKLAADRDPEAGRVLDRLTRAMAALPTANSVVDVTPLGGLGRELGLPTSTLQVRTAPYDYAGSAPPGGHVPSVPQTGRLSVGGRAGHIDDSDGERPEFVHWVGIAVTSQSAGASPGQTVRVSPSISWEAGWTLKVSGIGGAWADAEGGVNLKVFGPNGFVTENGPVPLFSDHHEGSGLTWNVKDRYDSGGTTPGMHVWFPIPAGETRWVNVDAYVKLRTGYNGATNAAAASAGLAATVRFIVLDPK